MAKRKFVVIKLDLTSIRHDKPFEHDIPDIRGHIFHSTVSVNIVGNEAVVTMLYNSITTPS